MKSRDTSWNSVAGWYDDMLADSESYQQKVILPNLMRLAGEVHGKKILDLACGQGFFSESLVKAGASVIGVDLSKELIVLAQKRLGDAGEFLAGSIEKLPLAIKAETFDSALCVLALQNVRDLDSAVRETARVLKPGGRFLIVLNHPAFRIPKCSSWGFDEAQKIQYRRLDSYLSEIKTDIVMNPSAKESATTVSFHRPLQVYFKMFAKHGFSVHRLEEWISHKKSEPGARHDAENLARHEFPLFLYLGLVKPAKAI
ncbi:MAG: hypothetical protein A3C06_01235 [Candidatus Taylorbacteria bacterium RIFCSPHIGHO2_02_FULL_46_13]|uniref:Methyltransferase type 11 domain-containing protein n=1 Tax=Candidatus Taylorbacteria bacterium RIFCSPHIGHO2_02_FULL_46_13 TaxID=1802312 RepID=A0A1G2MUJ1_9BACT|nr:MAG: hypothetical protein A3C06_01235 [Candidatus Taylorbacteria bacterium RIFCSPHIGHO2_02_FULL_46_13]